MKTRRAFMIAAIVIAIVGVVVACGDATGTMRAICRGDSVRADFCDTCLVRCSVWDSIANGGNLP